MAYTMHLDQNFISKYKGSLKNPGLTAGLNNGGDVTVFIPKDKASNSFYQDSKYDMYDHVMNTHGELVIDNIPNSGMVKFTKVGNGVMATGYFEAVVDAKGNKTKIPVSNVIQNMDVGMAYEDMMHKMANLSRANEAQLDALRSQYGIKNPQQLLSEAGVGQ